MQLGVCILRLKPLRKLHSCEVTIPFIAHLAICQGLVWCQTFIFLQFIVTLMLLDKLRLIVVSLAMDKFVFKANNTGLCQMMKCWHPKHFILKVNIGSQ
jgi:hypothetical protein